RRPFLPDAIEALVHLGETERAERLTADLEQRARALHLRSATVSAARCRALVRAARGEVKSALDGLDEALADGGPVPDPLTLARTLMLRGQLQRRRKDRGGASKSLRDALQLCEQ